MRRRRNAQDSLELFLDTICNMFGGFLFIMLFVVVAMRDSVENSESEAISQERMSAAAFAGGTGVGVAFGSGVAVA